MSNFVDSVSNSGQPWRTVLSSAGVPQLDNSGQLAGPWGDAIRAAVLCEKQGHNFSDGPAGQVIDFLNELGYGQYEDAANKTEQAAHQSQPAQLQAQMLGNPTPVMAIPMGIPVGMPTGMPIAPVGVPQQQMMSAPVGQIQPGYAGMAQLLESQNELDVRQVNFSGCDCCCCMRKDPCKGFPCCCCLATSEFEVSDLSGLVLLRAYERSGVWERICCEPNHSLTMKVIPGDTFAQGTDYGADEEDYDDRYANTLKFVTLERKGCSNGYCTCCFSCCYICNDNLAVYEGNVKGGPGSLENAPKMSTMIDQPVGGGFMTPTINVQPKDGIGTPMSIEGPCIFGGWSEIVMNSDFKVSSSTGGGGDIAVIKHLKPSDFCEYLNAFLTPLDRYKVTFNKPISGHDKANVVLSSFLVDYMFFELDDGPCYITKDYVKCVCFFCNCCGCLCPCEVKIPLSKGEDN